MADLIGAKADNAVVGDNPGTLSAKIRGINKILTSGIPLNTTARTTQALINISASGDNTIITGVALQTIRIHKLFLVAASNVVLTVKNGAAAMTGAMTLGSLMLDFDSEPWFITTAGNNFIFNLGTAVQVSGRIYYSQS